MDRYSIARALRGFGAGVQGKSGVFLEQLSNERKEAMLKDAYSVQQLLKANDPAGAQALLSQRVQHINRLGGDPSDTLNVLEKLKTGDTQGALRDVTTAVDFGTRMGYLKPPNFGVNPQTSAPKKVVGHTASGKKINGNVSVMFDPATGGYKTEFLPDVGQIDPNDPIVRTENVGTLGMTGAEQIAAREEAQERLKGVETEEQKKRIGNEKRIIRNSEFINEAMTVAEQIPTIRRAITLLDRIKTGNVGPGLLQWAKQFTGTQTDDEGELSNTLSVMILQQLRPTFGAQFTKAEGDWLKAIQPNMGKSNESNLRILKQLEGRLMRQLKQGMRYANHEDTLDPEAYTYIDGYVSGANDYGDPAPTASDPQSYNWGAIPGYNQLSAEEREKFKVMFLQKVQGGG